MREAFFWVIREALATRQQPELCRESLEAGRSDDPRGSRNVSVRLLNVGYSERQPVALMMVLHRQDYRWLYDEHRGARAAGGALLCNLECLRQGDRRPAGRADVHQPDRRGIRPAHDSLRAGGERFMSQAIILVRVKN